ncbi:phage tail fiber protein [Falsiroseomonas sp. E2-1-a20]|uniref:phage tail fiber protein n=1 Tax=Falsiroseomonas sp. E2-1-a20 TaxID=3239300 RepID=UPI003F40CE9B
MTDLTDHAKNLLARALCARLPTLPTAVFAALGTGGSDATGLTGEPAGTGYARQRATFTGTGMQRNVDAIRFTFTGAAGTMTHIGLFDAVTGGNPLTWSTLQAPLTVAGPGVAIFTGNALTVTPE